MKPRGSKTTTVVPSVKLCNIRVARSDCLEVRTAAAFHKFIHVQTTVVVYRILAPDLGT